MGGGEQQALSYRPELTFKLSLVPSTKVACAWQLVGVAVVGVEDSQSNGFGVCLIVESSNTK